MPTAEVTLPALYEKQWDAINDPARIVCIESTTKSGKTTSAIVWQIKQLLEGSTDAEHWWVAPVYEQAMMAYRVAWSLLRNQPGFRQALAVVGQGAQGPHVAHIDMQVDQPLRGKVAQPWQALGPGTDHDIQTDGLRVITTLDGRMQKAANQAMNDHQQAIATSYAMNLGD